MFQNIPEELKRLSQWVLWRYETRDGKPTKVPYCSNGTMASVSDPATWMAFEQAITHAPKYNGIGLVLTQNLGISIIDLDNKPDNPCTPEQLERHTKIYEAFNSYTELSTSGTGVHIIVRGTVPSGVHRDHVEIYSDLRYMVFTGNILRPGAIQDYQPLLTKIHGEMQSTGSVNLEEVEAIMTDQELVEMAMRASNADKFNALCAGDMTGYPSQSEADFALLSILAFYTASNEQVRNIFRMTALGKRAKATKNNTYLNFALRKIRSHQPPEVDMNQMAANAEAMMKNLAAPKPLEPQPQPLEPQHDAQATTPLESISLPPGLVGELAQYFYQAAIRPVPEIALAAAIALTAGISGRSYNISGSGLNQYIILLARTGSGKEGALSGIENLLATVRSQIPMIDEFMGPAAFASGQALVRVLSERPCFVSVLGEFGLTLQQLSDPRANSAEKMLKKVLLDVYAKSGWNRMLQSSVYSDVEKNTKVVKSPCITILGESTPETFFEGMDASHIAEGLIPRFSIMEYHGNRPPRNRNPNQPPPPDLVNRFAGLVVASITTTNNNVCTQVELDEASMALMDSFDAEADNHMNTARLGDVEVQLWNRAHLKALKMGALLAVGVNPHRPVVTADLAHWAIQFVKSDITRVLARFSKGDVGKGDSKQFNDLKQVVEGFFKLTQKGLDSYGVGSKMFQARVIPYSYLIRRTSAVASFRHDKMGSTQALKKTIEALVNAGMLIEISKATLATAYQYSGAAYGVSNKW